MTPMDDGLLSNRTMPRRDPSQRILSDMDSASRWRTVRAHPWSVALALVAPCALLAVSVFLMPFSPSEDELMSREMAAIALPSFVDAGLVIAPFHTSVSAPPVIAAPVRVEHGGVKKQVAHAKGSPGRKRRAVASFSADVAVLSVLVEHIDAQRRGASRGAKAE
jgi:hypothetical protein